MSTGSKEDCGEKNRERGHCGDHSFGNKDKTRFAPAEFVILSVYLERDVESKSGTQKQISSTYKDLGTRLHVSDS